MKGLLLTYLLAYGGAVASLYRPVIGLFIYVLFSLARPQMLFGWAGDLTGMSFVVALGMLAGWALHGFGNWSLGRAKPLVALLLAYFGWFCLAAAFAPDQSVAWASVQERAKVVLAFLVGVTTLDSPILIRRFAWLLVIAQGYVAAEMNWSYVIDGYNRAINEGLLGDNNSFAISMAAGVGPALFLAFAEKRWTLKAVALVCAALILHTVILTFSRGGILAVMMTGAVVLFVMPKRPSYLLAMVLAVALGARMMGPQVASRFMTTFAEENDRDRSAQSRFDLWRDCLTLMQRSPIVGIGPSHWPLVAVEFGWTRQKQGHSLWMQLGAEAGVPTLMFLLGFYCLAALQAFRLARKHRGSESGDLGMYVFSGLVGFIIAAQFVSIEGLEDPYFIVLVLAATLRLQSLPPVLEVEATQPEARNYWEVTAPQRYAR